MTVTLLQQPASLDSRNQRLENRNREPFSLFPICPSDSPDHSITQWPDGSFPLSPFSLFAFSPSYRFALSPFSLVTGLSAAGPLPPLLPGRGRPPPPGDYTPWPLGRRGRSSCRGTLRSSAPLSTAGPGLAIDDSRLTIVQNRDSELGARDSGFGARGLPIDDCRLMIAQSRGSGLGARDSGFVVLQS